MLSKQLSNNFRAMVLLKKQNKVKLVELELVQTQNYMDVK